MLPPSPKRLERDEAHTPQRSLAIDRVAQDDRLLADIQVLMGEQRGVMAVITGQTTAHADVRAVEIHPVVAQERPQREHLGRKKSPKGQCAISVLEGSER